MMIITILGEILSKRQCNSSGAHSTSNTSKKKLESGEDPEDMDEVEDATKIPLIPGCKMDNFVLGKSSSQRTGFTIQYISRAWNCLAEHMSYSSLEEMVVPYLKFDTGNQWYDVIERRDEGYMPIQSFTEFDTSHQPTRIQTETFNGVVDLPYNVDRSIRVLIKKYLNDIRKYCFLNRIYGATDQDKLVERL